MRANRGKRAGRRLLVLAVCTVILAAFGTTSALAQAATPTAPTMEDFTNVKIALDTSWVLLTGFLVFFMQTGFALLETGIIRQTSAVNALLENFIDAGLTALIWWAVGFGIAFGASQGGLFGTSLFFPGMAEMNQPFGTLNISVLTMFFFQFAFAATASTITTGSMAERTDFIGDLIYSAIIAAVIYPVVVHWVWGGGWLAQQGFLDFAGSNVVHTVGGVIALIGAWMLGPRAGRVWGKPPRPHSLAYATLGTMILWFGWYGFNPGSTLGIYGYGNLAGLVVLNTTLAAGAGAMTSMFAQYFMSKKWDLLVTLNGSLAGLVAVTAGCAFVSPVSAVIIGAIGGIVVLLVAAGVEKLKIDDAVGAFAVHGGAGIFGVLAVGLFAESSLTVGPMAGQSGLLLGGGTTMLGVQALGSLSTIAWVGVTSLLMFGMLKAINRLRVNKKADEIGIDVYEHGASVWPDVLPHPEDLPGSFPGGLSSAPAAGD
ncbi:MAG TPA: ammonium transporter [Candidatus Limnocylindrales bacterium]|nr:ammonium transporter [Candidatus Limnocylindrales bacterium]